MYTRRLMLGAVGVLAIAQAKKQAIKNLATVAQGGDPFRDRNEARIALTVRELAERFLEDHARPHKKPSCAESDERRLNLHVLPRIGACRVVDVTRQEIADLHRRMKSTPIIANRVLALLGRNEWIDEQREEVAARRALADQADRDTREPD